MSYYPGRQAYRPEEVQRQSIGAMVDAFAVPDPDIEFLLGPTGPISKSPNYQDRPGQRRMAQMVRRGFKFRKHVIVEAGTGTGKSLAVLVPAVLYSLESGKPVIIATSTNALADQYLRKDIPFLLNYLSPWLMARYKRTFRAEGIKGLTNYLCELKASKLAQDLEFDGRLDDFRNWHHNTQDGDLGTLDCSLDLRRQISTNRDECQGKNCPAFESCYYYAARARVTENVNLVVTTHAMLCMAQVKSELGTLLPEPCAVIVDEAHKLGQSARSAMEVDFTSLTWQKRLSEARGFVVVDRVLKALYHFSSQVSAAAVNGAVPRPRNIQVNDLCRALEGIEGELGVIVEGTNNGRADVIMRSLADLRGNLLMMAQRADEGWVLWEEVDREGVRWHRQTPTDYGDRLSRSLFAGKPVVLCSATLATSRDEKAFDYIKTLLGCQTQLTLQIDSPFNWERQALLYIPPLETGPKAVGFESHTEAKERYLDGLEPFVREVIMAVGGRTFVLCTSRKAMVDLARQIGELPYQVILQDQFSPEVTRAKFMAQPSVLFATQKYFEGIDVPGSALSCVIVDQLPFGRPSDPVDAARVERAGRAGFHEITLPAAITLLRQAVGRLIRTETDKGLIVLCDPRIKTKNYGADVLAALPQIRQISRQTLPKIAAWLAAPIGGKS